MALMIEVCSFGNGCFCALKWTAFHISLDTNALVSSFRAFFAAAVASSSFSCFYAYTLAIICMDCAEHCVFFGFCVKRVCV